MPWLADRGTCGTTIPTLCTVAGERAAGSLSVAALVEVMRPLVPRATAGFGRAGRAGLWNEVGDGFAAALTYGPDGPTTSRMRRLRVLLDVEGVPWKGTSRGGRRRHAEGFVPASCARAAVASRSRPCPPTWKNPTGTDAPTWPGSLKPRQHRTCASRAAAGRSRTARRGSAGARTGSRGRRRWSHGNRTVASTPSNSLQFGPQPSGCRTATAGTDERSQSCRSKRRPYLNGGGTERAG